jgi:nucleotide-binding universal stress UspA family protein
MFRHILVPWLVRATPNVSFLGSSIPDPLNIRATLDGSRRYLKRIGRRLQGHGVGSTAAVVKGSPAGTVTEAAAATSCEWDLVAFSAQGVGLLRRNLLGSVADKVAQCARVPVLVTRRSRAAGPS